MLTDTQSLILCSELNRLLWTKDAPAPSPNMVSALELTGAEVSLAKGNMQCVAHAMVCAGIALMNGETVKIRGGSAIVVYPELTKDSDPHWIAKHWWISTNQGLCDLSLRVDGLSKHKPVIYRNRNLADPKWQVVFKDNFGQIVAAARKCHESGDCGVFYETENKKVVARDELQADLSQFFPAAEKIGIPLRFRDLVAHC